MEKASLATHAMVSYLAVTGPQTKDNALLFLGSLLARQFAVVDGTLAAPNVTVLSGSAVAVRAGAASAVSRAAGN